MALMGDRHVRRRAIRLDPGECNGLGVGRATGQADARIAESPTLKLAEGTATPARPPPRAAGLTGVQRSSSPPRVGHARATDGHPPRPGALRPGSRPDASPHRPSLADPA